MAAASARPTDGIPYGLMNEGDACVDMCERFGLELLSVRPASSGGSRYVAHVRDKTGRSLLLKQAAGQQGPIEAEALRAWHGTRAAARLVRELEDGAYLAEWLDGISLAEVHSVEPVDFVLIGRMLRSLHAATTSGIGPDIRERLPESVGAGWQALQLELRALAGEMVVRVRLFESPQPVLLHGDLVPSNVMLTSEGPKVIDPNPGIGPSAWDIAQLAVASAGRGRYSAIGPLLKGYGSEPPLMAEMYAWMVLWFFQRNLAAGRAEFSDNLRPLAEELARAGTSERFLDEQLVR